MRKIINDPVYGFISINDQLIMDIINHPYYQRLRRIKQMALAGNVYPGAVHTRLHHSLGAYHLISMAVQELRIKDIEISPEEELAIQAAILLHDIGHGPYSHALEGVLVKDIRHESLSISIMKLMNEEMSGRLTLAIQIFENKYVKPFLHQLLSGQLDMDRLDYLSRDSFYTGVSEGVVGYDRIIKMLTVRNNELVVEEKGIHSVEKFLIARRQMYWQVYLHKAVLASEKMLVKAIKRAQQIFHKKDADITTGGVLDYFLKEFNGNIDARNIDLFCKLDDADLDFAVKKWANHSDKILSLLCTNLLNRDLFKCIIQQPLFDPNLITKEKNRIIQKTGIREDDISFLLFTGEAVNTTYQPHDERINILTKTGDIKDISEVENSLIDKELSYEVRKNYLCFLR